MTTGERQRLVAHFEMTEAWLDSEVGSLSDAQLKFKMTPESWSVEEVVMHLAIAEPQYWTQFRESLARPVQPEFKPQATDVLQADLKEFQDANQALVTFRLSSEGTFATATSYTSIAESGVYLYSGGVSEAHAFTQYVNSHVGTFAMPGMN